MHHHELHSLFLQIALAMIFVVVVVVIPVLLITYKKLTFKQGIVFNILMFFTLGVGYHLIQPAKDRITASGEVTGSQSWNLTVYSNKKTYPNKILVSRQRNKLYGQGTDSFGYFYIEGRFTKNKVMFNKYYDAEAKRKGALTSPICFSGIIKQNKPMKAMGMWESSVKLGYDQSITNPSRLEPIGGKWSCEMQEVPTKHTHLPQAIIGMQRYKY